MVAIFIFDIFKYAKILPIILNSKIFSGCVKAVRNGNKDPMLIISNKDTNSTNIVIYIILNLFFLVNKLLKCFKFLMLKTFSI